MINILEDLCTALTSIYPQGLPSLSVLHAVLKLYNSTRYIDFEQF